LTTRSTCCPATPPRAGGGKAAAPASSSSAGGDRDDLIDRAVANGDEHVIKLTEACLQREALAPSPVYRAAIGNVLAMIGPR
jgi:hypothetical protein